MKQAILLMGYHEAVQVHKKRIEGEYNGWGVCLDEVESLGSFAELEQITESDEVESIQDEMFSFLESLGAKKEDRVTQGYDGLVYVQEKGLKE